MIGRRMRWGGGPAVWGGGLGAAEEGGAAANLDLRTLDDR